MKHTIALVLLLIAVASLVVLAGRQKGLEADLATGGDQPSTNDLNSGGVQPVNIINWLIDENGNLKVSNQVRDEVRVLVDSPISVPDGGIWQSEWVDSSRYNTLRWDIRAWSGLRVYYMVSWFEGHEYRLQIQDVSATRPGYRWDVLGPRVALRLENATPGTSQEITSASVYLRAE